MHRTLSSTTLTLTLLAAFVPAVSVNAQAHPATDPVLYRVTDLGTLGGDLTEPGGINDRGEVEGLAFLTGNAEVQAFYWYKGRITGIPGLGGPNSTAGWAISNSGQMGVAGETHDPDPLGQDFCGFGDFTTCLPFVWQHGAITLLPLPAGNNAAPTGFNNVDEVTGKAQKADYDPTCSTPKLQTQGIVWRHGKIERLLPDFPGDTQGAGHSINDLGQVVGWSGHSSCGRPPFVNHALLWDPRAGRIDLGALGNTVVSQAYNINNKGDVVGFSGDHGFLWRRGHIQDLGVLPGDVFSFGAASNDAGEIVGASGDADGNERAVLWYRDAMIDLNTLIPSNSPLYLLEGDYINSSGQIVGIGVDPASGQVHGFVAKPIGAGSYDDTSRPPDEHTNLAAKQVLPENVRDYVRRRLSLRQIELLAPSSEHK